MSKFNMKTLRKLREAILKNTLSKFSVKNYE